MGASVGWKVGAGVGYLVGASVGAGVGYLVGELVGAGVGYLVGASVGEGVGYLVGEDVTTTQVWPVCGALHPALHQWVFKQPQVQPLLPSLAL